MLRRVLVLVGEEIVARVHVKRIWQVRDGLVCITVVVLMLRWLLVCLMQQWVGRVQGLRRVGLMVEVQGVQRQVHVWRTLVPLLVCLPLPLVRSWVVRKLVLLLLLLLLMLMQMLQMLQMLLCIVWFLPHTPESVVDVAPRRRQMMRAAVQRLHHLKLHGLLLGRSTCTLIALQLL
jgi:hypothetical protein